MCRKIYLAIITILPVSLLLSCKKDDHFHDGNKTIILNVAVNAGETYQLNLAQYGDADDLAVIIKQASTYSESALDLTTPGNYLYRFLRTGTTKTGGNGTDQVVLKIYERENRCRHHDETNITINFTIL